MVNRLALALRGTAADQRQGNNIVQGRTWGGREESEDKGNEHIENSRVVRK